MDAYPIPATSGIYRIICTVTDKFYIGSSTNLRIRRYNHFRELRLKIHPNQKLQHAWNKYGEDAFTFEILELVLLPELLTVREQYWFDKFKPFGNKGFNMTPIAGSTLGRQLSPETKEKIRLKSLGKKMSEEARHHMGESHKGTKRSTETRAKMSQSLLGNTRNLGKKLSPERRENLRLANLGKKRSEEARAKMSESKRNRPPESVETREKKRLASLGREQSIETRVKRSASNKIASFGRRKTLIVTSPDGIEYTIIGIHEFCREHHLDRSTLMRVAKGEERQHKGWKARFPEMDIV